MFKANWRDGEPGHPSVHNDIARRLNRVIYASDFPSLQAAVDVAARQSTFGGAVVLSPGVCTLDAPVILPRSGLTPAGVVHLVGMGRYTTLIAGSPSFPKDRALIEWQPVAAPAQEQCITNLSFKLPNVAGVRAIHWKPTAKATFEEQNAERLSIQLENIHIGAHNDYHTELIYLEGAVNRSSFRNISGDPAIGSGTYTTTLLKTDTDLPNTDWGLDGDMSGLMFCRVEHIFPMVRRGGKSRAFDGRMNGGVFESSFADHAGDGPCYRFVNSIKTLLRDLGTEGRYEQVQYEFTNCRWLTGQSLNMGGPDAVIDSMIGVRLSGCSDCTFDSRIHHMANPLWSERGGKLVVIDATSKRNIFTRWGVKTGAGGVAAELQIDAPRSAGNRIEYIDVTNDTAGIFTP